MQSTLCTYLQIYMTVSIYNDSTEYASFTNRK